MIKDSDGAEVRAGDLIHFAYGIPPVGVEARVIERNGKLIALTPEHKPQECPLHTLKRHVGEFYKIQPRISPPANEPEVRIFRNRTNREVSRNG